MFFGDLSLAGSVWTRPAIYFMSLSTIFVKAVTFFTETAQWIEDYAAILAWPTFTEAVFLPFVIWACRGVERALGRKAFLNLMIYNAMIYLIVWSILVRDWRERMSMLWFYPYSVFVFVIVRVPAIPVLLNVTDKFITSVVFLLCLSAALPYSLVPLGCAILGNALWSYDVAKLANCWRCCEDDEGRVLEEPDTEEVNDRRDRISGLERMTEAGFSFAESVYALQRNGNDPRRACEFLMMQ